MRSIPQLGPRERRVLGALLEKEQTTPEYYPLTLKAVVAACNQKSNRDPVMSLEEADVHNVLRVLVQEGWVERVSGARVDRWKHSLESAYDVSDDCKALLTLLLLRGAQTPGELRSRSERLFHFDSLAEVLDPLHDLSQADPPLVVELARQPGQKETRWILASNDLEQPTQESAPPRPRPSPLEERMAQLEEQVEDLSRRLTELESLLN
ncbi:MAG TPA: DUF480 domain-containing protein [Acidobacteriota bacterium]|nr:DUF480 domain-containing protein [Acidobacteriota bacterium]